MSKRKNKTERKDKRREDGKVCGGVKKKKSVEKLTKEERVGGRWKNEERD